MASWGRRKRFEARILAVEIGTLLAGGRGRQDRVPADRMWEMIDEIQAP